VNKEPVDIQYRSETNDRAGFEDLPKDLPTLSNTWSTKMKFFATAAFAFAAVTLPTLASAGQAYYDPAEGEFAAGSLNAAAATNVDAARYTQTVTFYDPAEGEFVTSKVSGAPVIGTHDAVKSSGSAVRFYDPAEGEFVN
jgi:hypothetical protein